MAKQRPEVGGGAERRRRLAVGAGQQVGHAGCGAERIVRVNLGGGRWSVEAGRVKDSSHGLVGAARGLEQTPIPAAKLLPPHHRPLVAGHFHQHHTLCRPHQRVKRKAIQRCVQGMRAAGARAGVPAARGLHAGVPGIVIYSPRRPDGRAGSHRETRPWPAASGSWPVRAAARAAASAAPAGPGREGLRDARGRVRYQRPARDILRQHPHPDDCIDPHAARIAMAPP